MIDANTVEPMPDPDPIPLTDKAEIPPFPVDSLPKPIASMVYAVAEATQTDPAMAGTAALSALSACTGGHADIEIRQGWREPLHIYTATIAAPGERKSSVQLSMVRPIHDVEEQLAEKGEGERLEAETRKQAAVKAAERARNAAASAEKDKDAAMADAIGAAIFAESIQVPAIPRIVADDVTPEAATSLLAEQGGRLAIISAEGGIFDIIAGRYSGAIPNMDVWLKGHAGDHMRVDRKGRLPEYIRKPALTLGLMIQPSVLTSIAGHREFRGRGFLARILYARPASKVGSRKVAATPVSEEIKDAYETVVKDLASGMAGWLSDPAILMLSPDAQKAMIEIETAVEPTLAGDGELASLADWGAKYVGAIARIAGIIHLAEHGSDKGPKTPVTAVTILAAARIGAYFKANAINAFIEMGTDMGTADAVYLLDRIQHLGLHEVSERDLHVATKSRFKKKDDLLPALDRLVDHGYLIPLPVPEPTGAGRPASPRYRVQTTEQKEHKEQK
jgi:replicative DNA helicase